MDATTRRQVADFSKSHDWRARRHASGANSVAKGGKRHTATCLATRAGSAAPSARRAPSSAASAPWRRERAALPGGGARCATPRWLTACPAAPLSASSASPRRVRVACARLRNGSGGRARSRRTRGRQARPAWLSGACSVGQRHVTEPKFPALLMLAAQCAVRPCASARSRNARAQAAARARSSHGLAAAPRVARCSRTRAGALPYALQPRRSSAAAPRRLVTTCGLPIIGSVPVIGPLLSSPLVTVAWAVGGFKLFTGFSKTTYTDALLPKLALCTLWCATPAPQQRKPGARRARRPAQTRRRVRFMRWASFPAGAFRRRAR